MSESPPAESEPRDASTRGAQSSRGGASRLAWLDALRGFAALCVVFDHASSILLLPARSSLYQWFNLG